MQIQNGIGVKYVVIIQKKNSEKRKIFIEWINVYCHKIWDELSAPVWNGFMSKEHQYCECNHTIKNSMKNTL